MYGKNNFISKAFCLLMDMDQMIGEKYEEGLENLQRIVEVKRDQREPAQAAKESKVETQP